MRFGRGRTPVDYLLVVFLQRQLSLISELTSTKLIARGLAPTTAGEIFNHFGVLLLATRFEFGSRAELWSTTPPTKHMPDPEFSSRTGMSRNGFDNLWSNLFFSRQPAGGPSTVGTEQFRRWLVNVFVAAINKHREDHVTPGDTLCVDESISKWYGQGGHWISVGFLMCVAIDRKPENGCEMQNTACGRSGIMLRLKIVTTAADHKANLNAAEQGVLHGIAVLWRLVAPWAGSGRIVVSDSYFASVEAVEQLAVSGLRFIGVVKTAHRRLPMASLSFRELLTRGDHVSMAHVCTSGRVDMMAVLRLDRDRRYSVATAGSTQPGPPCERLQWRETPGGAQRVAVTVPQPEVAATFSSCAAKIVQHNR